MTVNIDSPHGVQSKPAFARYIVPILLFSFVINALYLVGPIYMMQVYDRVLSSGSVPTLVGLSMIAALLYVFFGVMDYIRNQLLSVRGEAFAQNLAPKAFRQSIKGYALDNPTSVRRNAVEDVSVIRQFLTSSAFTALMDLVWMPIFLGFIFIMHKTLGITALAAAAVLVMVALLNERVCRAGMEKMGQEQQKSNRWARQAQRNAATILGNGMGNAIGARWYEGEQATRQSNLTVGAKASFFKTITKTTRLMVQSLILGLGAYLAIGGEMSAGAMIAASIIFSRTIAPVEQILGQYGLLLRAKEAWGRVQTWCYAPDVNEKIELPQPTKELSALIRSLTPPDAQTVTLQNVQLKLNAGDVLGVIGPSGGGKSSLAKALCGAWAPQQGVISLDGADLREWPAAQLSRLIGYMPQTSEFFEGTIAENIAGFSTDLPTQSIIDASMLAGAHELILSLPNSYNTKVGPTGLQLSAGQLQRISLARALYGDPFVVILDEPNSNLDSDGEAALAKALRQLKQNGKIAIVIAHRPAVLREATHLCKIEAGVMAIFGPKQAVQKRLAAAAMNAKKDQNPEPKQVPKQVVATAINSEPQNTATQNPTSDAPSQDVHFVVPPHNRTANVPANPYAPQTVTAYAQATNGNAALSVNQ